MQNTTSHLLETSLSLFLLILCAFITIAFTPALIEFFEYVYGNTSYEVAEWVNQPHPLY